MTDVRDFFRSDCAECFVIAEVAQTHDGSLGQAHAFIDAVAETGANAIKFQTHIADAESTPQEPFRVQFSKQDPNRYAYWKRMEFTEDQWRGLAEHSRQKGLVFLSSPFSLKAVELLSRLDMAAWKIGSGEVNNFMLLERVAETGKPILLSSGMSTLAELEKSVDLLRRYSVPFAVFQATTMYPTPPEKVGLNMLATYQKMFRCRVGLSDHSGTIYPSLAAYVLGARFFEVHVTLSRRMFGPDVSSSITIEEMIGLVKGLRFLQQSLVSPIDKESMANELSDLRRIFQKSIVATGDLPVGKILQPGDLALKKPGKGIPAELLPTLYGKRLKRALTTNEFFSLDDVEGDQ